MKKLMAILLAMTLLMTGLAGAYAEEPADGAWEVAADATVTEERRAVFDAALENLLGVDYEPIAYLASQTVAGTNHCFLCRATVVYPGAEPYLTLVYIYEDLNGNAQVTGFSDLDIAALNAN